MKGLTIGKLARESGVGVETIRFYERKGLIEQPERPPSGYRHYAPETVTRVKFIRNSKELGFSLREIEDLLSLAAMPGRNRREMRRRAEAKMAEIDMKMDSLLGLRRELAGLVDACREGGSHCLCPIVEAFEHRGGEGESCAAKGKE